MKLKALQFLFMEGDPGDKMYIIRKGHIRIMKREGAHMTTLSELGPGSLLGEMSLLDKQPRSATAKTLEETELIEIDQNMLEQTLASLPPWITTIIRMIVQRLRETTCHKYQEDIRNSIPSVIFSLIAQRQSTTSIPLASFAQDCHDLYGISFIDLRKILLIMQKLHLVDLDGLDSNDGSITIVQNHTLELCWKNIQDQSSPHPHQDLQLNSEQYRFLKIWMDLAREKGTTKGETSLVEWNDFNAQLGSPTPQQTREIHHQLRLLILAQHFGSVPILQKAQGLLEITHLTGNQQHIESLIHLYEIQQAFGPDFSQYLGLAE